MDQVLDEYANITNSGELDDELLKKISVRTSAEFESILDAFKRVSAVHTNVEVQKLYTVLTKLVYDNHCILENEQTVSALVKYIVDNMKCNYSKEALVHIMNHMVEHGLFHMGMDTMLELVSKAQQHPPLINCPKTTRREFSELLVYNPSQRDLAQWFITANKLHFGVIELYTEERDPECLFNVFRLLERCRMFMFYIEAYIEFLHGQNGLTQREQELIKQFNDMIDEHYKQPLADVLDSCDTIHYEFLGQYTPICFVEVKDCAVTNQQVENELINTAIIPEAEAEFYQLISERVYEYTEPMGNQSLSILLEGLRHHYGNLWRLEEAEQIIERDQSHDDIFLTYLVSYRARSEHIKYEFISRWFGLDERPPNIESSAYVVLDNQFREKQPWGNGFSEDTGGSAANLFSFTPHGYEIDMYYYISQIYIQNGCKSNLIGQECAEILQYFNIKNEIAALCAEQINREFEFDNANLNIKQNVLSMIMCFQFNEEYEMTHVNVVLETLLDMLMQEVTAESFVYFNIVDSIVDAAAAGTYDRQLINSNSDVLIHLANNIIAEGKYMKYEIQRLFTNLVIAFTREDVLELNLGDKEFTDECSEYGEIQRYYQLIQDNIGEVNYNQIILENNSNFMRLMLRQKAVGVVASAIDERIVAEISKYLHIISLIKDRSVVRKMFAGVTFHNLDQYIGVANALGFNCFDANILGKEELLRLFNEYRSTQKGQFEYIRFLIDFASDYYREDEEVRHVIGNDINLLLTAIYRSWDLDQRDITNILEEEAGSILQEVLVISIAALSSNQNYIDILVRSISDDLPSLAAFINSLDQNNECILRQMHTKLEKFADYNEICPRFDDSNIIRALITLFEQQINGLVGEDFIHKLIRLCADKIGSFAMVHDGNAPYFSLLYQLLNSNMPTFEADHSKKLELHMLEQEILFKLKEFLEGETKSARNIVRKCIMSLSGVM